MAGREIYHKMTECLEVAVGCKANFLPYREQMINSSVCLSAGSTVWGTAVDQTPRALCPHPKSQPNRAATPFILISPRSPKVRHTETHLQSKYIKGTDTVLTSTRAEYKSMYPHIKKRRQWGVTASWLRILRILSVAIFLTKTASPASVQRSLCARFKTRDGALPHWNTIKTNWNRNNWSIFLFYEKTRTCC